MSKNFHQPIYNNNNFPNNFQPNAQFQGNFHPTPGPTMGNQYYVNPQLTQPNNTFPPNNNFQQPNTQKFLPPQGNFHPTPGPTMGNQYHPFHPQPSLNPQLLSSIQGNVGIPPPNYFELSNCISALSTTFSKMKNDMGLKKYRVIPKLAFKLCWQLILDRYSKSHDRHNSLAISEIHENSRKIFCIDFCPPNEFISLIPEVKQVTPEKITTIFGKDNVLFLANMLFPPPKEFLKSITDFLNEGGKILFIGCNPSILSILFGSMIKVGNQSCCTGGALKFNEDRKKLFSAYKQNQQIQIETNRTTFLPFSENPEICPLEQLAWIGSGTSKELLICEFPSGNGKVVIFSSKCFLKEQLFSENLNDLLEDQGASKTTISAWKCARKVGYDSVVILAAMAYPSLELVWNIILE